MSRVATVAALVLLPGLAAAQMGPVPPPPMAATPGVLKEIGFDQRLGIQFQRRFKGFLRCGRSARGL